MGQQLRDPWGILVAALSGGLAAAVAVARGPSIVVTVLAGLAVAVAVYGARVVAALTGRSSRVAVPADVRPWLTRAFAAADAMAMSRKLNRDPRVAALLADAAGQAQRATQGLYERALAVSTMDRMTAVAAGRPNVEEEYLRLTREADGLPDGPLRADKLAAAAAAGNLADSHRRLASVRARLLATIESTVLQLEASSARGALLVSMGSAQGDRDPAGELSYLADEIEAVRSTLEQTEEITRELLDPAFRPAGSP